MYVARAVASILRELDSEYAVVHSELEARLAERGFTQSQDNIDPHHITTALNQLIQAKRVLVVEHTTKGNHLVKTIQPANTYRRATNIASATKRKRTLYGRYLGWAQGTSRHPQGLIGPAGEAAVRKAILASAALQPAVSGAGEVPSILGLKLPGPLDSAGYMVPFTQKIPGQPVTLLFEVKNIRSWIYPQSPELFQLLNKAVLLQQHRPELPILPILVCRAAHKTAFYMAKQLGFIVIDMKRQFVGAVDEDSILEVSSELHFTDLKAGSDPSIRVLDRLRKTLPSTCTEAAKNWRTTATDMELAAAITALKSTAGGHAARARAMDELRALAIERGHQGGW